MFIQYEPQQLIQVNRDIVPTQKAEWRTCRTDVFAPVLCCSDVRQSSLCWDCSSLSNHKDRDVPLWTKRLNRPRNCKAWPGIWTGLKKFWADKETHLFLSHVLTGFLFSSLFVLRKLDITWQSDIWVTYWWCTEPQGASGLTSCTSSYKIFVLFEHLDIIIGCMVDAHASFRHLSFCWYSHRRGQLWGLLHKGQSRWCWRSPQAAQKPCFAPELLGTGEQIYTEILQTFWLNLECHFLNQTADLYRTEKRVSVFTWTTWHINKSI